MNSKAGVQLVLVAVLLGAAAWMMRGMFAGPRIDLNPYQALGGVAAEETSALAGGSGRVVLVIPDPGPSGDPVQEAQVAAFRKSLGAQRGVEIKAVETVMMDPVTRMQTGGAMPPAQYMAVREKHADAAVFVLFLAFPPLGDSELSALNASKAKVMVVSPLLPGYDVLLKAGAIHVAIVPRSSADEAPASSNQSALRAAFDREYVIMRR